jgi:hypothetical protein
VRERAKLAIREADRAEAEAWSNRCKTRARLPLDAFRRPRDTADLETRSGAEMPVMPEGPLRAAGVKLTTERKIASYVWVIRTTRGKAPASLELAKQFPSLLNPTAGGRDLLGVAPVPKIAVTGASRGATTGGPAMHTAPTPAGNRR